MKKKIIIPMILIFAVILVSAGVGIALNSQIDIDDTDIQTIKDKQDVSVIDIEIIGKGCDDTSCVFKAYQENVTNTIFVVKKTYVDTRNITQTYTDAQMRTKVEDMIEYKLTTFASAIRERDTRTPNDKSDGVVEVR